MDTNETAAADKVALAVDVAKAKTDAASAEATNKVAVAAAQASFDHLIVESLRDIRESVGRVEEKTDRVDGKVDRANLRLDGVVVRMDTLVETTNHRLDAFTAKIDGKLDDGELLTSVGFKLLNNKVFRWGFGIVVASLAGTTIIEHWTGFLPSWMGF